ncbi:hypothetical protein [Paenibacillus beijingensis]|uniref:hypothetical protein n=1 Tax=Paenibacillus beijingensis TaxID=1126833 RepID=UPI000696037E|nr:hypothetical protein [Paenibacillus beijingensis]
MDHQHSLLFEFADDSSAALASDTLCELGYEAVRADGHNVSLSIHRSDLTSALEIAFAHGGQLHTDSGEREEQLTAASYGMSTMVVSPEDIDTIPIPAHIINEDWIAGEELRS